MWPFRFDLDIGESYLLPDPGAGNHQIKLLGVKEYEWADYYTHNPARATYSRAEISVEVDGNPVLLIHRPYQLPTVVNGVRIYVEATLNWANRCEIESLPDLNKAVRFSALPAGAAWGPEDLVFPIAGYRWRSAVYNNTWSALVPYNLLYYHRGEDYGAIPDRLDVVAVRAGEVVFSPVSTPQSSNLLTIQSADGRAVSYCHMNIESIRPDLVPGKGVAAGEMLAKTGETWDGRRCQDWDPHLHVEFEDRQNAESSGRERLYSPYPFLVQAYLRTYPDPVVAVAGGYAYALPGEKIRLDGSQSLARPGEQISEVQWRLSDGRTVHSAAVEMEYDRPGLYAEELIVTTEAGGEDRDFAHVRVYDPTGEGAVGCGFFYHTPVRDLHPGTPVLFWNRLQQNIAPPVMIDFGDGTPPQQVERECTHTFHETGIYTCTLSARGLSGETNTLKMRVVID
jgi:murein DD-endopeptidase MepM/ murein hydrolase activator NlpD